MNWVKILSIWGETRCNAGGVCGAAGAAFWAETGGTKNAAEQAATAIIRLALRSIGTPYRPALETVKRCGTDYRPAACCEARNGPRRGALFKDAQWQKQRRANSSSSTRPR